MKSLTLMLVSSLVVILACSESQGPGTDADRFVDARALKGGSGSSSVGCDNHGFSLEDGVQFKEYPVWCADDHQHAFPMTPLNQLTAGTLWRIRVRDHAGAAYMYATDAGTSVEATGCSIDSFYIRRALATGQPTMESMLETVSDPAHALDPVDRIFFAYSADTEENHANFQSDSGGNAEDFSERVSGAWSSPVHRSGALTMLTKVECNQAYVQALYQEKSTAEKAMGVAYRRWFHDMLKGGPTSSGALYTDYLAKIATYEAIVKKMKDECCLESVET